MKAHSGTAFIGLIILFLVAVTAAPAAPPVRMEGTAIIGEQEQPRIHFTLPWKAGAPTRPIVQAWASMLTKPLAPVNPTQFKQQLQWQRLSRSRKPVRSPREKGE